MAESVHQKPYKLSGFPQEELKRHLFYSNDLIDVCRPFIKQLETFLEGSDFLSVLTDQTGCVLYMGGADEMIQKAAEANIGEGSCFDRATSDITAIGHVLEYDQAFQLKTHTELAPVFSDWKCSAAPIHDKKGNIIGVLNITGHQNHVFEHTLGLVVMMTHAIESKLQSSAMNRKLFEAQHYAFAMMNNLSFGVFAVDLHDQIQWVNDTACRSINIRRLDLINRPISDLLPPWKKIKRILLSEIKFLDEELPINIPECRERFLFNAYPINAENNEILGYLVTFRSYERAFQLANKIMTHQTRFCFDDIVAKSTVSKRVLDFARKIARSPSTVLITGESGTGKEVFAQAIHNFSARADKPFIAINCGAISPSLIESELFGYEEGAFTGAIKGGKTGKFEQAAGGTLFLDEIGEMPADMQVKLLRVLQEGSFTKVGGDKSIQTDVRIIAATNRNLQDEVNEKKFRLDLYYRLNVINLNIPPLRERPEDIPTLVQFFLVRKSAGLSKPIPKIDKEEMQKLCSYAWPGNIRELENTIERMIILQGQGDLPEMCVPESTIISKSETKVQNKSEEIQPLWIIEKQYIEEGLKQTNGNMSLLARKLDIGRNTLYQKIKKYGILGVS